MTAPFDLSGRTAVVTGASSGLGRRISVLLAEAGAVVFAGARRSGRLARLAAECAPARGRVEPVELDVTRAASIDGLFERCRAAGLAVDILVNNAGVAVTGTVAAQGEQEWDSVLDTNLKGAWLMTRALARTELSGDRCSVVNMASILGFRGANQLAPYCASKAGLINLTRSLAVELARKNIRVNAIAPGYIRTEMNEEALNGPFGETMRKRIPLREFGRPEDLDGAVLYLCSDASRYVTGTTLVVDGGLSAGI